MVASPSPPPPELFTATTVCSLAGVCIILLASLLAARAFLPATASNKDRFTFIWLAFDALIVSIASYERVELGGPAWSLNGRVEC